jgi:signal transduction histidine kinase
MRRNGERVWIAWTNRILRNANTGETEVFSVGTDITKQRRAETALRELNETLEQKVATRTEELRAALVRAEAADQIKSAFLATMSHELRTPLNSIIGFTGIVLQGLAGPLNEEQTKQLGMVRGSARHLLELINDVLDISKIEAGQLDVRAESFDLRASIERVVSSVKLLSEKRNLALTATLDPALSEMYSDRRRLEQVLLNLLNNAIKFTERGSVSLTVDRVAEFARSPDEKPGPAVRLRVADTGIGIKPEDLPKLFQPFRQIESGLARSHEGTGLGLAICRRLAVLMGGSISVASEWSRGSVFTVILPLRKPPSS